ncbi:FecR domain-containing protein [Hymenobacter sp. BT507]|uniref:FecR domain-containing protein n=1 Tax=Hymenobacter citatus TaxID=2763506 RepID=A0ABR7MID1_9BACT|nr:FecR domain-containing protein [Hymenobacter citatus]MBC6610362.1 FecR domain-containing protein [Hymenobacter citatus]
MPDYPHFCAEEFAQDEFFVRWVLRPDAETEAFWQQWLSTFAFRRDEVEAARQLVLGLHQLPQARLSSAEKMALRQRIFAEIETAETPALGAHHQWLVPTWQWVAAASVLLFLLGIGQLWQLQQPTSVPDYRALLAQARRDVGTLRDIDNPTTSTRLVSLPDGSSVLLRPHSRLAFPARFAGPTRPVYLEGSAFFEVAKDPQKPFFVNTSALVTKVLGTSFEVQAAAKSPRVVVTVKTGRVSVYPQGGEQARQQLSTPQLEGLVLTPNQQATYGLANHQFTRTFLARPALAGGAAAVFEYEETPIREVFAQLEEAYGVSIEYDKAALGNCPLTASFTDEPLFEKLRLICKAVRARYEVQDAQIVVTGLGCQ